MKTALTFTPDWENAKVVEVDDIVSISTTMATNLSNYHVDKYYALVIKMDGKAFDSKILDIKSKDSKSDEEVLSPLQMYQTAYTAIKSFPFYSKEKDSIVFKKTTHKNRELIENIFQKADPMAAILIP